MKQIIILCLVFCSLALFGQSDSLQQKNLDFTGDFRFRIEHDWNSYKQNGIKRKDRSRLRYRFRFGVNYRLDQHSSFGARLRSGNINDQQGPHVTLGGNKDEFGLVRIGLEKLFYQYKNDHFKIWLGKNSIPIKKLNEMFWCDNVYPSGIGMQYYALSNNQDVLNKLQLNAGHFIIRSSNQLFAQDSYFQLMQLHMQWLDRIDLIPGFYYFKRVGNYPDNKQSFELDYSIFHLGTQILLDKSRQIKLGLEYYQNLQDYSKHNSIPELLKDQTQGFVLSAQYGALKQQGDWLFYTSYAHMQKYAVVDYFAQNDWARWDYSSVGAAGSRLTNLHGIEFKIAYALKEHFNLNLRAYIVE